MMMANERHQRHRHPPRNLDSAVERAPVPLHPHGAALAVGARTARTHARTQSRAGEKSSRRAESKENAFYFHFT